MKNIDIWRILILEEYWHLKNIEDKKSMDKRYLKIINIWRRKSMDYQPEDIATEAPSCSLWSSMKPPLKMSSLWWSNVLINSKVQCKMMMRLKLKIATTYTSKMVMMMMLKMMMKLVMKKMLKMMMRLKLKIATSFTSEPCLPFALLQPWSPWQHFYFYQIFITLTTFLSDFYHNISIFLRLF